MRRRLSGWVGVLHAVYFELRTPQLHILCCRPLDHQDTPPGGNHTKMLKSVLKKAPPRASHRQSVCSVGYYALTNIPVNSLPSLFSSSPFHDVVSAVTTLPLWWDKAAVVMCSGIMCRLRLTNGWLPCILVCC